MEEGIKRLVEKRLDFVSRNPKFRKIIISRLIYLLIAECEPEDLKYLNIDWIARKLGVSISYASRCFKSYFGRTPRSILIERKIELAMKLLTGRKNLSVRQVAELLDFCSVNYFITVFKKQVKETPLQFRKKNRVEKAAKRRVKTKKHKKL